MLHVGTTNPGKIAEIAALLSPLQIDIRTVSLDVPETADNFDDNAMQKAVAYAAHTGGITLCEDSGLIVPALNGLPGPWSARFCDHVIAPSAESARIRREMIGIDTINRPGTRFEIDLANNLLVLEMMKGIEQPKRAAYFVIVLIVQDGKRTLFKTRGECHGWIADSMRGDEGFGYDPIFVGQDSFGKTFAELDPARKNLRSHRKRALDDLFAWASQNLAILTGSRT